MEFIMRGEREGSTLGGQHHTEPSTTQEGSRTKLYLSCDEAWPALRGQHHTEPSTSQEGSRTKLNLTCDEA